MNSLTHVVSRNDIEPGWHVYVYRMGLLYQHHGIVISRKDAKCLYEQPDVIEDYMIIEQNRYGLQVVTIDDFLKGSQLRRVYYGVSKFIYKMKRAGTCYLQQSLNADQVVKNAIDIYNDYKIQWKKYSVIQRNCEHFAFLCSTLEWMISEQMHQFMNRSVVPISWPIIQTTITNILRRFLYVGEKIFESTALNLTITSLDELVHRCVLNSGITTAFAFSVEAAVLSIRWITYLSLKNKSELCQGNKAECKENQLKFKKWYAAGWIIETDRYIECLIQAAAGNVSSFGLSIVGGIVGAFIPIPLMSATFSILFGIIGYMVGRYGSGIACGALKDMFAISVGPKFDKDNWCKCLRDECRIDVPAITQSETSKKFD